MAKVKIKFNRAGFNAARRDPAVKADIHRRAQAIANAAGEGFVVIDTDNAGRSGSMVVAETFEARRAEATDKVLTKAIDAGRG